MGCQNDFIDLVGKNEVVEECRTRLLEKEDAKTPRRLRGWYTPSLVVFITWRFFHSHRSGTAQDRTVLSVAKSDRCRLLQYEAVIALAQKSFRWATSCFLSGRALYLHATVAACHCDCRVLHNTLSCEAVEPPACSRR